MRIKLTDDQLKVWDTIHSRRTEVHGILSVIGSEVNSNFVALKEMYPTLNFAGARIDHETGELVLPYQTEKE